VRYDPHPIAEARERCARDDRSMRDPKTLLVVQEAERLAVDIYRLTAEFPPSERFGLCAQMRRAAISIGSNIAEGCGRRTERDFLHFLYVARGSAVELAYQLRVARVLGFGQGDAHAAIADRIDHVQRMLNRFTTNRKRALMAAKSSVA
jgi:four helix bundle protein